MDVERLVGDGPEGVHDERADGDVGHEAAVHDVDVHPVAAGLVNGLDLRAGAECVSRRVGGCASDPARRTRAAGAAVTRAQAGRRCVWSFACAEPGRCAAEIPWRCRHLRGRAQGKGGRGAGGTHAHVICQADTVCCAGSRSLRRADEALAQPPRASTLRLLRAGLPHRGDRPPRPLQAAQAARSLTLQSTGIANVFAQAVRARSRGSRAGAAARDDRQGRPHWEASQRGCTHLLTKL